jgi:LmbE family N-acetylglucosaminyl deacetylase
VTLPAAADGVITRQAQAAPLVGIETIASPGGLLIIVPHPDDETLGCGMALAAAAASGQQVGLLLMTDGEASHPGSRTYPADRLRALRRAEFARAVETLTVPRPPKIIALQLADGRTSARDIGVDVVEHATALAQTVGAGVIWSTWHSDPHCDHETAAALARQVAQRCGLIHWSFPVWGRYLETPLAHGPVVRFSDPSFARLKRAAVACYASQMTNLIDDDPGGFRMPAAIREDLTESAEIFIRE